MKSTENRQCNTFNRTKIYTLCVLSAGIGVVQRFAEFPMVLAIAHFFGILGSYIYLGFFLLLRCQTFSLARAPRACFPVSSFIFLSEISLDFCQ